MAGEERRAADPVWQTADAVMLPERDASAHASCADVQINYANEANLDENVIVSENGKPVEVTADCGPDLGLDKGQEAKAEITNAKLEILNPEIEIRSSDVEIRGPESRSWGFGAREGEFSASGGWVGGSRCWGEGAEGQREAGDEAGAA